jgi:hypothetical protein
MGQGHWQLSRRKAREALVTCLAPWRPAWPAATRVVVLDNGGDHKSRQPVPWWPRWHHQRRPRCRPADSPEWHLRERVWRHVKDKRGCHRWWADWQALWEATAALLTHLTARFHQPARPGVKVVQNFCSSA